MDKDSQLEAVEKVERPTKADSSGQANLKVQGELTTASFISPLPPPAALDGYEKVCPGAAREILDMAKINQEHRHRMESLQANQDIIGQREHYSLQARGQRWAGGLVVGVIASALYMIHQGNPGSAVTVICSALATYAGAFVFQKTVAKSGDRKAQKS